LVQLPFAVWVLVISVSLSSFTLTIITSSSDPVAVASLLLGGETVTVPALASTFSWSVFFLFSSLAHFSDARCFFFSSCFFFLWATCFCSSSAAESFFFLLAVRARVLVADTFIMLYDVGVIDVGEEVGMVEFAQGVEEPEQGRGLGALADAVDGDTIRGLGIGAMEWSLDGGGRISLVHVARFMRVNCISCGASFGSMCCL
jgi:hypothetical protein